MSTIPSLDADAEFLRGSALRRAEPPSLRGTVSAQAAARIDRGGGGDVSNIEEMKDLPGPLRDALIREMARCFSGRWSQDDPGLKTATTAAQTLARMAIDRRVVFQAQYDRGGRLVSTSAIVDRDRPRFDDTGDDGSDRYGDHWIANVFTTPARRGKGLAAAQIRSLQRIAATRDWPQLWLYCRERQDGVELPRYYGVLGFEPVGEERLEVDGRREREIVLRFDTRAAPGCRRR